MTTTRTRTSATIALIAAALLVLTAAGADASWSWASWYEPEPVTCADGIQGWWCHVQNWYDARR